MNNTNGDYVAGRPDQVNDFGAGRVGATLGPNNYREVLYTGDYSCGDAINQESWVLTVSGDYWNRAQQTRE